MESSLSDSALELDQRGEPRGQSDERQQHIRTLMGDDGEPPSGDVEIDETSWGGKARVPMTREQAAAFREEKATVLGMVEHGGRIRFCVVPSRRARPSAEPSERTSTRPRASPRHKVINHSAGLYVRGDVYTNTIESAFGNLKTGMRGVYKKVSPAYLQNYLDEYAWRHNANRDG
jgi:hypothetical protein